MKNIFVTIMTFMMSLNSWGSGKNDLAKQVVLFFIEEPQMLWSRDNSGDVKYFELSKETVIAESLSCEDYDDVLSLCSLTAVPVSGKKYKVEGLVFLVDSKSQSISRFAFIPLKGKNL